MDKVLVIAGPTAVGKTQLSINLAKKLDGEIVSADSMQIYKGLNIGTAKPTLEERSGIPHHMMDLCEPFERFSVADYVKKATEIISDITSRSKLPIIVGGTGLYIDHLIYKTDFEIGDTDPAIREELSAVAEREGGEGLKKILYEIDPESANRLHINDIKRMIRAIEFYRVTGTTITEHNKQNNMNEKRYDFKFYVLSCDRPVLYERIDTRVDKMMQEGLLDEAKAVCQSGWFSSSTASQAIGYKEFLPYFNGECLLDFCVDLLKQHSRNYAKRQLTWFRAKKEAVFLDIFDEITPEKRIARDFERDLNG